MVPGRRAASRAALEESSAAVICVTPENRNSEWILFESGAVAKQFDRARVIPVLIDGSPEDLPIPLRQFQAVSWSESGLVRIAESLNEALGKHQARASELAARMKSHPPPFHQIRPGARKPGNGPRAAHAKPAAAKDWKLDRLGRDILVMAAQAQDRLFTDAITIDDVVEEMELPRAKAALYLDRLRKVGYLSRGGKITHAGSAALVELGLL